MFADHPPGPGDIIRRRIVPFVFVRQHESEIPCMIIPVAGDDIEDHAAEQFHFLRMGMCQHAAQLDKFLVVKAGDPEVRIQHPGHTVHMVASVARRSVKAARHEIRIAVPRR